MPGEYDVIVYGTVCLDLVWRAPHLPPPDGFVEILEERKMVGGEASNTAIALARWGVRVALVGNALGEDEDGDILRALFARQAPEIDTRFLETHPGLRTPFCVCIATPDGHRTMIGTGSDALHCPQLDPDLARSARLFTTDPNPWEAGAEACEAASNAGLQVVAMDYTRHSAVNRLARIAVTSHAFDHEGGYARYAQRIRDADGPTTIVTCGVNGCYLAEAGEKGEPAVHIPAYVAPEVVDTTGAGDVFRAGLLYGQLQAWDMLRTVRFASAAAALNCGAMGGWGGVRSLEEIEAFQREAPTHPTESSLA